MLVAFDVEYRNKDDKEKFDPNDLDVDKIGILLKSENTTLIQKIMGEPYDQLDSETLVYIFEPEMMQVVPVLMYALAKVVPEDIIILSHNYEYDSQYIDILSYIRENVPNFIEIRTKNLYSVIVIINGKIVSLIDTAKFEYKPLKKKLNALRSKRMGKLEHYLINDLIETVNLINVYSEIEKIIELGKWTIENANYIVGGSMYD